ncbi:MAG: copper resistance protein B [Candidatus Nitrospinota bacterium M3_3B_026]
MTFKDLTLAALVAAVVALPAGAQETPQTGAPADWPLPIHDDQTFTFFQTDRLEYRAHDGDDGYLWDAQGWIGTDPHKLWLKTEGEGAFGEELEKAEVQALYSRILTPFFDVQAGVRQDLESGPNRTYGVVGLQGLAPYWFEVDGAFFVSNKGDVTARIEAEYELLFTQRLILQPRAELNFAFQDVDELGIGSGLSTAELGARLRYEITRQFAPYIGVSWERSVGDTADFVRAEGGDPGTTSFVAGLRLWF